MSCQHSRDIHLYHDGRLSTDERCGVETHLADCAECREELREIAALSRMLAGLTKPALAGAAMGRLQEMAESLRERDLMRICRRLTAAALLLLAIGLAALLRPKPAPSQTATSWEIAMLGGQSAETVGSSETGAGESADVAQWLESGPAQNGGHE